MRSWWCLDRHRTYQPVASFASVGDNQPAPGRRTTSSMSPTLVTANGELRFVLGSPGGDTIPSTIAQVFHHLVDHGMPLDQSVEAGRLHHSFLPDEVRYERARPPPKATLDALRKMGHAISKKTIPRWRCAGGCRLWTRCRRFRRSPRGRPRRRCPREPEASSAMTSGRSRADVAAFAGFVVIVAFAVALHWPGVHTGLLADDYLQRAMLDGTYPVRRAPWDLYAFFRNASEMPALTASGTLPWWMPEDLRLSLLVPAHAEPSCLGSISAYRLSPLGMHLHSLAWLVAFLFAFRELAHRLC
ncbi:MAG: gamma-glutamyltransferase [Polyangiaceae bacterium]